MVAKPSGSAGPKGKKKEEKRGREEGVVRDKLYYEDEDAIGLG